MIEQGTLMMFPTKWEYGRLDSALTDSYGNVIAYIMLLDDGTKVAVDMTMAEALDDE